MAEVRSASVLTPLNFKFLNFNEFYQGIFNFLNGIKMRIKKAGPFLTLPFVVRQLRNL